MPAILPLQMAGLLLSLVSIGAADSAFHGGRIAARTHSTWVALTLAVMCLPILTWTTQVFVGGGLVGRSLVAVLEAMLFLWLYRNLCRLQVARNRGHGLPPQASRPPANRE